MPVKGHFDHIGALDKIREHFAIEAFVHEYEAEYITNARLNESKNMLGYDIVQRPAEHLWHEMGKKQLFNFDFEVRFVPGHSPGHVCYYFEEDQFVIAGDTLFQGSIGRTDLYRGSMTQLLEAIDQQLLSLAGETRIYPGHGAMTMIEAERKTNPFLRCHL